MTELDNRTISFRHLFAAELSGFLKDEGLGYESAVLAIGEIIVALARYHEEGTPLFPEVFLCRDVDAAMRSLGAAEVVMLGEATLDADGVRRALKRTAPLSSPGWCVLLHVDGTMSNVTYGLVRIDPFVLHPRAMDRLRDAGKRCRQPLLGIAQMAENVIELRASSDVFRRVYLSGARVENELGPLVVDRMSSHLARALEAPIGDAVRAFWRRILADALRTPHGTLLAVVRPDDDAIARFPDASHLSPITDVASHVRIYLERRDEASRAAVQGIASLVSGMLRADGITVLRADGAVLACEAFVAHRSSAASLGGARRRTYDTLAADVARGELVAAFYRSQDGAAAAT